MACDWSSDGYITPVLVTGEVPQRFLGKSFFNYNKEADEEGPVGPFPLWALLYEEVMSEPWQLHVT